MWRSVVPAAAVSALVLPAVAPAAAPGLRAFPSCAALVSFAERQVDRTRGAVWAGVPGGPTGPAPRPVALDRPQGEAMPTAAAPAGAGREALAAGTDFSTTTTQEDGVDEPDVVKTDGRTMFVARGAEVLAVDVTADAPRLLGRVRIPELAAGSADLQLLLRGERLLAMATVDAPPPAAPARAAQEPAMPAPGVAAPPMRPTRQRTVIAELAVADPARMAVRRTLSVDGALQGARRNGATARVVVASAPRAWDEPGLEDEARGYVPRTRFASRVSGRRFARPAASCDEVRRPAAPSGTSMLSVHTIDLDRGLFSVDAEAVLGDVQLLYGSPRSLYVATQRWVAPADAADGPPPGRETVLHRFDATAADRTAYRGSGTVPGYLLNQFALSERDGVLRIATTEEPVWWGGEQQRESSATVTTLRVGRAGLSRLGAVGGLGRGERIYAVRFLGDLGYVVTFRQVDPLYVIDLSAPAAPRVRGELKIPGYSAYLHPVGPDRLLGVGQDDGGSLKLFDVRDPDAPRLVAQASLGAGSSSAVEWDHRAFLHWAPRDLAVLPVSAYGPEPFAGARAFTVRGDAIVPAGEVRHPEQDRGGGRVLLPVERSVVVGRRLLTLTATGLQANALDGLAVLGRLAFDQPR